MTRKMKDSGVDWIGEIPEEWEVSKYKRFTTNGMGSTILKEDLINSGIPVYSATKDSLVFGYLENPKIKLEKGDFIIPARGNSIGYVYMIKDKLATCTQTTIYSKINNDINKKYLLYQSKGLKDYWFEFDNTAIPQITVEQVANNRVLVPSMSEQNSIADFLDEKTQEIDNIISKTKKAIEEYKRYKQSLITETVTKGLDKNAPMKDSGIEWIGEIPEHWDATKLKNVTSKLTDGAHISPDTNEGKYYFVSTVDINNGMIDFNNALKTSKESYEYMVRTGCKPNIEDLLMSKDGTIGKMALVREENNFVVASSLLIISSNTNSIIEYIYYYLMSKVGENQIESYHKGSGLRRISIINTGNILITVPPLQEQKAIASYLDQKCSQIDQIISTKEKLLIEMEDYKKSLIYETVTGKREVE